MILVGNKSDLKEREVSVGEATKFARDENMAYIETSAALDINISKAFEMLTQALVTIFSEKPPQGKKQSIYLSQEVSVKETKKRKKKCCE